MHPSKRSSSKLRVFKFSSALVIMASVAACGGSKEPEEAPTASAMPATQTAQSTQTAPTAPDAPVIGSSGKLKIFILAGQSNMVGFGKTDRGGDPDRDKITCPLKADGTRSGPQNILGGMGSLRAMVNANPDRYSYLVDPKKTISYTVAADIPGCVKADSKTYSSWATRDDVYAVSLDSQAINSNAVTLAGNLTVGFGSGSANDLKVGEGYIGPEFGFGHVVGSGLNDKVLLIKTSWGGKSLAVDFRPPRSVGLGVGSPASTTLPDQTGAYYTEMVRKVKLVLSDIKKYYPDYDEKKGYEVVGLGWHQGWNDRDNKDFVAQYEVNLANLIQDLRKDLSLPNMLFVIGNSGMAKANDDPRGLQLVNAQASVADPVKYPKFAGNVSTVDTRPFHYPNTSPETGFEHHWNYNGESYFKVGEGMGTAMLKLMKP